MDKRTESKTKSSDVFDTLIVSQNSHAAIVLGHIHEPNDCIADVLIQASDGRHSIVLDRDGSRQGCTQITAPGRIAVVCGMDVDETETSLMLNTKSGDICIVARKGKIRLEATDIELVATGEGGSKGNITMTAGENVSIKAKKVLVDSSTLFKIASSGLVKIAGNSGVEIYGSLIREITDASSTKSKTGGSKSVIMNNI